MREIYGSVERGNVLETRDRNQTSQNVCLDVSEQNRSGVTSRRLITADEAHASLPVDRSGFPDLDPVLQVNLLWSPSTGIAREEIPAVPEEIQALIGEVETAGELLE